MNDFRQIQKIVTYNGVSYGVDLSLYYGYPSPTHYEIKVNGYKTGSVHQDLMGDLDKVKKAIENAIINYIAAITPVHQWDGKL